MKKFLPELFLILFLVPVHAQKEKEAWETTFEKSGFISTSDYNETMEYFQRFADNSEFASLITFGISPQYREPKYLIVTKENLDESSVPSTGIHMRRLFKPVVLIINGIHSGEIEGKDASMLLLREILISKEKEYLLDSINIIVVPIFNVDGHERKSKYNRINQNGPEEMGWRTTAQNLNLNRDWMKADAPEMEAMLKLINEWLPDFVIDTHTTDGADYQYTVTYSVETSKNINKQIGDWLYNNFEPYLETEVEQKGFLIFPYVYLKDWDKGLDEGLIYWAATPRFSSGYFALRNRPMLLIETHMLKPYQERVYATKTVLETTLEFVYKNSSELRKINYNADEDSRQLVSKYLPLSYSNSEKFRMVSFKGYEYYWDSSAVSGTKKLVYTDNKKNFDLKYYDDVIVSDSIKVAEGYYIPPEYSFLVEKLKLHGIEPSFFIREGRIDTVTRYKFKDVKFAEGSYEGRQTVTFDYDTYEEVIKIPQGSYLFLTEFSNARLLTNLLEPKSADSFIRWGLMNAIFEQKEYYEDYVMEKIAEEMLENDPELSKEFEEKLMTDENFKNNFRARLDFFYERSPYPDKQLNIYPILRIEE